MAEHAIQVTIGAKDEATKQIKEIDKQLAALTKKKATIAVDLSTADAQKELAKVTSEIEKLQGQKAAVVVEANVSAALAALDDVAASSKKTESAVKALGDALGPDLAKGADVDGMVADFQRLGLSVDDIIANADRLGGKLREIGQRDVGGKLTTGLHRAGEEARSAGGSASVFANAIGNSVQDLGQVAGLSGTAGVAIGQMGEYMADAAFSGEKFTTVLGNFGAVAGPIALLVGALQLINNTMAAHKEAAEASAAATEQLGKAMDSASDPALGLADDMKPIVDRLEAFNTMDPGFWTDLTTGIQKTAGSVPLLGTALGALGVDVDDMTDSVHNAMPVLLKAGVDAFDLSRFIAGTGEAAGTKISKAYQAGIISAEEYVTALKAITSERAKADKTKTDDSFFKVSLGQLRALQDAADKAKDPLKFYGDQWKILMNDLSDGQADTQAAADAVNFLSEQLGIVPDKVRQIALDELDRKLKATQEVFKETAKALEDWSDRTIKAFEDANQAFIDLGSAQGSFDEMSNVFKEMERNAQGLSSAFDLKNAPLEALDQVKDFQDGLRDLIKFIDEPSNKISEIDKKIGALQRRKATIDVSVKGKGSEQIADINRQIDELTGERSKAGKLRKIPNIFDPNDVRAGPFLQKIGSMRGEVQKAITDAFATGGPEKASATADAYVKQFVGALNGKIKASDIETLWGIDDLQATLKVAVDQASMAEAQQMLEILTNLTGENAWTAQLKFDLISGNIDANTAKELIARQVKPFGIDVNTNLLAPDAKSRSAAKAEADRWAAQAPNKISMGTVVDTPGVKALTDARNLGQTDANKLAPIVFPSTVGPPTVKRFDAGGTVGGYGGIAGERGPEIINRRYLTAGPTFVPPGTQVTSRRRTAVILRTRGTSGLRRYDGGGTVPMGPVTVNFNGVGAVGNRYEIDRQIRKSVQRIERIYGTRG